MEKRKRHYTLCSRRLKRAGQTSYYLRQVALKRLKYKRRPDLLQCFADRIMEIQILCRVQQ